VFIAASLDGYIARADGGIEWLSVVERAGEDYGYTEFLGGVDTLVMGRRTYDILLGFDEWPFAGKRCIVLTHARPAAPRADEEFASGAPAALLEQLGRQGVRRVYVDGGAVIRQFLSSGLVDDLTLSVIPVILGGGIRLFDADPRTRAPSAALRLLSAHSFESGLVQLRYEVAGGTRSGGEEAT
jgi:dihydrofolate reductase